MVQIAPLASLTLTHVSPLLSPMSLSRPFIFKIFSMKFSKFIFYIMICFIVFQNTVVNAHPHSWVSVLTEIEGDNKQISGLKMFWTFDLMTTSDALSDVDLSEDNKQLALQNLAIEMLENIKLNNYFTHFRHYGSTLAFKEVAQAKLILEDQKLTLQFLLELERPLLLPVTNLKLQVYEDSYYVDFLWLAQDDIQLSESFFGDCSLKINEAYDFPVQNAYDPLSMQGNATNNELGVINTQAATIHCL